MADDAISYTPVGSTEEVFEIDEEEQEEEKGKGSGEGGGQNQVDISCRILFVTVIVILLITVATSNSNNTSTHRPFSSVDNNSNNNNNDIIPPPPHVVVVDDDDDVWWKMTTQTADTLIQDIYDMDVINETTKCGEFKCYFASLSHQNEYGYLIAQDRGVFDSWEGNSLFAEKFDIINQQKSYDLAMTLQQNYGLRHYKVAPPIIMDCSTELANVLNLGLHSYIDGLFNDEFDGQNLFKELGVGDGDGDGDGAEFKETTEHTDSDLLVVQIVQQATQPNIQIHLISQMGTAVGMLFYSLLKNSTQLDNTKLSDIIPDMTTTELRNFFENINLGDDDQQKPISVNNQDDDDDFSDDNHGDDDIHKNKLTMFNTPFQRNLWNDWCSMRVAMNNHPQLLFDFQFFVDIQGHIWQIDLDRAYISENTIQSKMLKKILKFNAMNKTLDIIENSIIDPLINCSLEPESCF